MKKKKSSSIVVRLRMAFLMPFAAFILIVISILGFQYRKRAMDDIVSQLTYEDEILAQAPGGADHKYTEFCQFDYH